MYTTSGFALPLWYPEGRWGGKQMIEFIQSSLQEAENALIAVKSHQPTLQKIAAAASVFSDCLRKGGRVFSCGNGGSLCDAVHFAEELSGRYRRDRPPLGAVAISDSGHITCTGNDYGYDVVFSRFLEGNGRPGDALLALSTSGKSPSILQVLGKAQTLGIPSVLLTGQRDTPAQQLADITICTPAGRFADRVQELHIKIIHIMIELIERTLFDERYDI